MGNPIQSPWATLVFLIALMSIVGTAYFVYLAFQLRAAFPELYDSSPDVDGYWPQLIHDFSLLFAGILAFLAMILFFVSRALRQR